MGGIITDRSITDLAENGMTDTWQILVGTYRYCARNNNNVHNNIMRILRFNKIKNYVLLQNYIRHDILSKY